ncbi:dentin sialophosphoprotein-like isoform X2 [Betta splendens]|uniref:Dentin sialophosphoprotein-like isoform X2 n=1 Tax=Betta splendens TaxID=158456 RepID=A0A6P7LXE0_BETSP|nr:dentin sialophosphoprotein-like isoform X2 [Betta splendens]
MDFKNDVNAGGLLNQGDTCYLNNVKQELFQGFREAVERHNTCMDRHLKDLFDELQRRTPSTNTILNKLGIDRVWEQQDAAEFYVKILSQTSEDASQIFHGALTHTTICHNPQCGAQKPADSRFWHLPLSLNDSHSEEYQVVNGIREFFRDSHFSGLDQMYCEECDDKVDATVTCEVKHHPEVLVLLLKRFDFDYRYMRYVKNNRAVIVPVTLNLPENQTYELYAVVDHAGDLRGGHYDATIKSQDDDRWYNFNDGIVSLLSYQPLQVDRTERSHSAYLLFYRKQTSVTPGGRQTSAPIYHGLLNQGATCYLNSLLQVLFMTREFREAVDRYIMTLRVLLRDLHRHTVDACDIITKLLTTVFEPQEAAEDVQRISFPNMHQASQSQTRCCKCETGRSRESPLWHLPLTLMDSNSEEYSLEDGLKQSLTDQVSCERCCSTIDVITKCEVKHHPEVLVLLLKRFDFNNSNITFVKNNRAVKITRTLQMSENQTYELYAVVDHVGELKDGHHAVIASLNDGRWYNYHNNTHLSPFQHGDTEISQTVHLLFYRRQENTFSQDTREVFTCEGVLPATSDTNQSPCTETIRQKEEFKEAVEDGEDAAETGSTGENKETQYIEDQDSGADVRHREPHSEEDRDGNKTDGLEIMRHDDENRRRIGKTDELTNKADTVTKDERREDQDDEGVDDKTLHDQDLDLEGADVIRLKIRQCVDSTELKSTDNESDVLPHEGILPATSDTNQSTHTETMRQKEEFKEAVEDGDKAAETVSTGQNKETQITVCVEPTVPEARVCNVEDQDSVADVRQREPHSEEDRDGNKTDEQEIMRHNDENGRRIRETDDLTDKTDTVVTEDTRAEDQDVKGVDDNNDRRGVMNEQTVDNEESENLDTEHQVSEGANVVRLKIRQCVDNRDSTSTDSEYEPESQNYHVKKKQKLGDNRGLDVTSQNKSNRNNKCERENSDCITVHSGEKSDVGDGRSRGMSGRSSDGGVDDHRMQKQQEMKHKHIQYNQEKEDKKKRKKVHDRTREHDFPSKEGSADGRRHINSDGSDAQYLSCSMEGGVMTSEDRSQQHIIDMTEKARTEKVEEPSHGCKNRREQKDVQPDLETDTLTQAVDSSNLKEPETSQKTRRDTGKREETERMSPLNEEKHDVQMEAAGKEQAGKQRRERGGRCWWLRKWINSQKKGKKMRKNEQNKEDDKEKSAGGRENNDSDKADPQIRLFYSANGNVLEMKGQSEKRRGKKKKCCFQTKRTRTEIVEDTSHDSKKHRENTESGEKRHENRGRFKVRNPLKPQKKVAPQNSEEGSDGEGSLMGGRGGMENNDSEKQRKTSRWRCICCICGTC